MKVTLKSQFSELFCSIDQWQEKVCAKRPKTQQSGFKSSSAWTCERESQKRALPGTSWAWNKWGKLSLSQCCSHLTARNGSYKVALKKGTDPGLLSRNCKLRCLTRASNEYSPNAVPRLWDGDGDRIRRRSGILSDLIREDCNRKSAHRQTALTSCPCWGIFTADAAPRLYCF